MHSNKALIILIALIVASSLSAQNVYDIKKPNYNSQSNAQSYSSTTSQKTSSKGQKSVHHTLTGFTGGMKLHMGYAFANSPDEIYHNGSLQNMTDLPTKSLSLGLGGELRFHLVNHVHLGAEGGMSAIPLRNNCSIRMGWGGALCDFYGTVGKVQLCVGGVIGGGTTKRLYVPQDGTEVKNSDGVVYNASFTETPFFLLDPYVGLEVGLNKRMGLLIKFDYMLPFGKGDTGIEAVRWSNFLAPSGPRMYIGIMFGLRERR